MANLPASATGDWSRSKKLSGATGRSPVLVLARNAGVRCDSGMTQPVPDSSTSQGAPPARRKCNCSGSCAPKSPPPAPLTLDRRGFLGLTSAGAAALLAGPDWLGRAEAAADLEKWKQSLAERGEPRVYRSDLHTDARMHLGGIGTGNFELGADGQFTTWQLFNTLRDGHVPFYLAVKVGEVAHLLQTTGGPAVPRVARIEMVGEYPIARLRFIDAALPIELELEAFSPLAPLDERLSAVPLAALVFRVKNPTATAQTVSLAAFMQNPVGYDAVTPIEGDRHPNFGWNVNEPFREGPTAGIFMRAEAGQEASLDQPVELFASANLAGLNTPPADRPASLKLTLLDQLPGAVAKLATPARTVVWIEEPGADFPAPLLRAARDAVLAGATLAFAGKTQPLLGYYAQATGGKPLAQAESRPDILFDDFEDGYGKWTITGNAFGAKPAGGTLPNQQRVSGFLGRGMVNTYLEGDGTTGRAVSREFKIERRLIRFLIGGGARGNTQLRLVVGGQVVRRASGKDNEKLEPSSWDVSEFADQTGHLEIVDEATGGWGHVNVDQIEFSDQPGNRAVLELLEELLPASFTSVRPAQRSNATDPNSIEFAELRLREGAEARSSPSGLRLLTRPHGKGRVVLAGGAILNAGEAGAVPARQRAYALLCGLVGVKYTPVSAQHPKAPGFGTLALAALGGRPSLLTMFNGWDEAWKRFAQSGRFAAFDAAPQAGGPSLPGTTGHCALGSEVEVAAGQTVEIPFLLTWHYPNKYNAAGEWMGCHYATQWPDARAVLREAAEKFAEWRSATDKFRRAVFDSTLPWWLRDCLTANAAIIRHIGVVFRIANGDTFGWEGSNGCCQPTCTHVWGYEQTLARLFPGLERDMRRIDFKHQQREDGGVNNRTDVPSPPRPTGEQPFADGHASCVLKAYREALNSSDGAFFKEYWPHVRRAVDYLIARDAKSHGGQPAGYLEDDQWNTYDEALHGVTTFISGYYLAALRAGEEWARRMGDSITAHRFREVFTKGQRKLIALCWNGEYFQQNLPDYAQRGGEVGPGCMSDQLIGQWWAHQIGLGYILPQDKVVSALQAVFKYNWKSDLTGWKHAPRAFAGDGDKGLIICTWPKGGRPAQVMLYSDEVWTGIEYQVAAHMIYEGLVEEGLAIAKGARERYDGRPRAPIPRNPWNEIECGGHYARAMSSWSLLLALSGWEYDGPNQALRFAPRLMPENFKSPFVAPEGWGSLSQRRAGAQQVNELGVIAGELAVKTLELETHAQVASAVLELAGKPVAVQVKPRASGVTLNFASGVRIHAGETLAVTLT